MSNESTRNAVESSQDEGDEGRGTQAPEPGLPNAAASSAFAFILKSGPIP